MFSIKQLVIISLMLLGLNFSAYAQTFVFVKNRDNPIEKLKKDEVMKIILGDVKEWSNNDYVQLVLYKKGTPQMHWLAKEIFGVTEMTLLSRIAQNVFKGELRKPVLSESDNDTFDKIKLHRGAIGIVSSEKAKHLPQEISAIQFF